MHAVFCFICARKCATFFINEKRHLGFIPTFPRCVTQRRPDGAAALTGLSPATIGRRMVELEERIGKALFQRSQTGYALTPDGRALFDRLQAMENAAKDIEGWQKASSASSVVRVAVGTWNAWLLTGNFSAICTDRDDFRIDLFIAEQRASLAHRENDIGIRAFEPEERNLAAIKTGRWPMRPTGCATPPAPFQTGGWRWRKKTPFPPTCAGRMKTMVVRSW